MAPIRVQGHGGVVRLVAAGLALVLAGCTNDPGPDATPASASSATEAAASDDGSATALCPVTGADVSEVLTGEFGPVQSTVLDGAAMEDAQGDFLRVGCAVEAPGGPDRGGMVQVTYAYYVRPPVPVDGCRGVELQAGTRSAAEVEVDGLTDLELAVLDITDESDEYRAVQTLAGCFDFAPDQAALVQLVLADESDLVPDEQLGALLGMLVAALPDDGDALADLVEDAPSGG